MAFSLLAVDDEPDVLKTVKTLVESLGYKVLAIADSREAAERINHQKFDGVFLDARMPHLNGFELTRHIRSSPSNRNVPIVMLTGHDDVESMREGFKAGITLFLGKPLDVKKLRGLLAAMSSLMLIDKRRYARLPLRTVVHCKVGKNHFKALSSNISLGGILLEPSGGADVGQEMELRFGLPEFPGTLNPRGKVIRKEASDRVALQFLALGPEDRNALQQFIAGLVRD